MGIDKLSLKDIRGLGGDLVFFKKKIIMYEKAFKDFGQI